jgi:predicted heme/steroid binding protein
MVKRKSTVQQTDAAFGVLDVLRVISGLLLLNLTLSYWLTSSTTWGYEGRWKDTRYIKFRLLNGGHMRNMTSQELSLYNGSDPHLPIYLGIYGKVYDVTNSRGVYGPGGAYSFFSGKDGARAFVTGCFLKKDEITHDIRGLDEKEALRDIHGWQLFFENHRRYWPVGTVHHGPLTGEPPQLCEGMKFPGTA